jgi:hypothetical protein
MGKSSLTILVASWWLFLLLFFVFTTPIADAMWFAFPLLYWGVVAVGGGLVIALLFRAKKERRVPVLSLVMACLGLVLFFTSGFQLGRKAYFQIRKGHYEALLEKAVRTGEVPTQEGEFDEGPPPRYAFYWQRGITDNWAAVVHDPTGLVLRVNEVRPDLQDLHDPKWSEAVSLFGGDLHHCEHLGGDWYLCWFT